MMMRPVGTAGYAKTVEIASREELEAALDRVVEEAIRHGLAAGGNGILVARRGPGTFTVELSGGVPQGTTAELDLTM